MLHEGDWERGCALVERARQLNPNHPGWYWFAAFWDAYRKQDYRGALEVALKINMPGDFYVPAVIAAAYGQLGELEAARTALLQLLAMKPDFAATAREEFEKWFGPGELVEHFLDGLRKAGLEIAPKTLQPYARPRSFLRGRLGRRARRRRFLGRGAAIQVQRRQRRSHGAGRRTFRGHRHRPVALLLPQGDRAQLDVAVCE